MIYETCNGIGHTYWCCLNPNNRQLWLHQNPTSRNLQTKMRQISPPLRRAAVLEVIKSSVGSIKHNITAWIKSPALSFLKHQATFYRNIRHGLGVTSPNCTIYYVHFIKEIKIKMFFGTIFHSITHPDVFGAIKMSNLLPNLIGFECQHVFFCISHPKSSKRKISCLVSFPTNGSIRWLSFKKNKTCREHRIRAIMWFSVGSQHGTTVDVFFLNIHLKTSWGVKKKKTPQTKQIRFKYVCSEFCVYVLIHVYTVNKYNYIYYIYIYKYTIRSTIRVYIYIINSFPLMHWQDYWQYLEYGCPFHVQMTYIWSISTLLASTNLNGDLDHEQLDLKTKK